MKINGRAIADSIYDDLKQRTEKLKEKGVIPHIAVILIGNDPGSLSYVSQKEKWGAYIGALFSLIHYPSDISEDEVLRSVKHLNADPTTHGIIIQRPLPPHINKEKIIEAVTPEKDIDGFRPDSPYIVPVAAAVIHVLQEIYQKEKIHDDFMKWLQSQNIVIVGRGETAGGPIIRHFKKSGLQLSIITSITENPKEIMKKADVLISAVGREEIVTSESIKDGVILLGVGIHRGRDNKLRGDYISINIKDKARYYTPATGGIGPVNVAHLLSNLVSAAESQNRN